jgi:hypothetical protein
LIHPQYLPVYVPQYISYPLPPPKKEPKARIPKLTPLPSIHMLLCFYPSERNERRGFGSGFKSLTLICRTNKIIDFFTDYRNLHITNININKNKNKKINTGKKKRKEIKHNGLLWKICLFVKKSHPILLKCFLLSSCHGILLHIVFLKKKPVPRFKHLKPPSPNSIKALCHT